MTPPKPTHRQTLALDDRVYETTLTAKYANRKRHVPRDPRRLTAIIPGLVLSPIVRPGDRVRSGQDLLILEAMKMENHIGAHGDLTVKAVHVAPGDVVAKGQLLIEFH
jgi:biotin carboxyl carrier protein